jgi:hypothetical protein
MWPCGGVVAEMGIDEAYKLLGLRRGASKADITRALRKLSWELHPETGATLEQIARYKKITQARKRIDSTFEQVQAELKDEVAKGEPARPTVATYKTPVHQPTSPSSAPPKRPTTPPDDRIPHYYQPSSGVDGYRRQKRSLAYSLSGIGTGGTVVLQIIWLSAAFYMANVVANGLELRGHRGNLSAWTSWLTFLQLDWLSGIYTAICLIAVIVAYRRARSGSESAKGVATFVASPFILTSVSSIGMAIFGGAGGASGVTSGGIGGALALALGSAIYVGSCYVSLLLPEWVD